MRKFIRHSFDVSMHYAIGDTSLSQYGEEHRLKDVSEEGICFYSPDPIQIGTRIRVKIPVFRPSFEARGTVCWCKESEICEIGVKFDEATDNALQMVDQACHIKHYLRQEQKNGRNLNTHNAAREWIKKCASDFSSFDDTT